MQYLNELEIFEDMMLRTMPEDQKTMLKTLGEDDLVMLHHGLGTSIRNHYKMWDTDNPHFDVNDARGDKFPDQASQRIIERLWCTLNNTFISTRIDHTQFEDGSYHMDKYFVDAQGNRVNTRPVDGKRERTMPSLADMLHKADRSVRISSSELQETKGNFKK